MNLQKQPNRASCLLTSFAMAIDQPVKQLMEILGHDGTEIISDSKIPFCYAGFHVQECFFACSYFNKYFSTYEVNSIISYKIGKRSIQVAWDWDKILKSNGVMVGSTHAVACSNELIYDPNGTIYKDFDFHTFYKLVF